MSEYREIIETSIYLFDIMGVNPLKRINKFKTTPILLMFILMMYLIILCVIVEEVDLKLATDIMETTIIVVAASAKMITLITNTNEAKLLIEGLESFWPVEQDAASKYQQELDSLKIINKIFVRLMIATTAAFVLRPLIAGDIALICYIPKSVPFILFSLYTSAVFVNVMILQAAHNTFTFSLIRILTLQFRMINEKLTKLEFDSNCVEKIKSYVDYYNFLLKFLETFNDFNQAQLLIEMQVFVAALLLEFLHLSRQGISIASIRVILVIVCVSIIVVILICWPGSQLSAEAGRTVFSIYDSKWYDCTDLSVRKQLIIMMQSAQKDITVTAGNLIFITMETSTQVFKTAYSFFTFVSNMKN